MLRAERYLYGTVILVLLLWLLYLQNCKTVTCPDVIVKETKDTTYHKSKDSSLSKPKPIAVIPPKKGAKLPGKTITIRDTDYVVLPVDTAAILKDHYSKYLYIDTVQLKYGNVMITDTISQNLILGRRVTGDFTIPEITVTRTVTAKKRNQLYIGLGVMGTPQQPIQYIGSELTLKTKTDKMYSVGTYIDKTKIITYKAGIHFNLFQ